MKYSFYFLFISIFCTRAIGERMQYGLYQDDFISRYHLWQAPLLMAEITHDDHHHHRHHRHQGHHQPQHHPHYLTLLMTSEMAEITPDKERRVEEEVVDGRQDQQRRISQQGLRECFSPPTSSVVMFRIQEDLFFERRI